MINNENKNQELKNTLKKTKSGFWSVKDLAQLTGKSEQDIFYFVNDDSNFELDFIHKDTVLIKKKEVLKPVYNIRLFLQKLNYLRANYKNFNSLLSFKELSEVTLISQNTFSKWHNGKVKSINPVQLKKLLNVFKVKSKCFDDDISLLCVKEYFEEDYVTIFLKQKDELTRLNYLGEAIHILDYQKLATVNYNYNKLNKILYDHLLPK